MKFKIQSIKIYEKNKRLAQRYLISTDQITVKKLILTIKKKKKVLKYE